MSKLLTAFLLLAMLGNGTLARADQIRFLPHGEQSLSALYQTLQSAKSSIDMVYYIFDPCSASTKIFMRLLSQKARQKVQVRVVLDAFSLSQSDKYNIASYFAQNGIELKFYNDTLLINPEFNYRSHIKLTLVDGQTYLTGGRNMSDEYFGLSTGTNYVDRDVLVMGASSKAAASEFAELWASAKSTKPSIVGRQPLTDFMNKCFRMDSAALNLQSLLQKQSATILAATSAHTCETVKFAADSPQFSPTSSQWLLEKRATQAYIEFLQGTAKKLEIENWSYMPSGQVDEELTRLRNRQVRIQVLTNGSAGANGVFDSTMHFYANRDSRGAEGVLQISNRGSLQDNSSLTPSSAQWKLHSKVAVRDGQDVLVGSYNLDPRSYGTNLEAVVVAEDCPALAQELEVQFSALKSVYLKDAKNPKAQLPENVDLLARGLGWLSYPLL